MSLVESSTVEISEPIPMGTLEQMERATIDIQIATAKKYPRELSRVKQKMLAFATLDTETAAGCFYTLPARKGGDGKVLQGPSVRLAEIALSSYGHLRAGSRVISDDGKALTAQAIVHDLENNVCISIEVKRRITTKDGRRFSDDMVNTTGNAACSIALRNATFRVIPLALVKPVYEAAKRLAVGDAKSLATRRADSLAHFAKLGVDKAKVFAVLGISGLDDITLDHLEILLGYATAIKDGEVSIDDVFNPKKSETNESLSSMVKPKDKPAGEKELSKQVNRDDLVVEIEGYLLEAGVSDGALLKEVVAAKLVENPDGFALLELSTADLEAVRAYIAAKLKSSDQKGGK